MLLKVLGAVDIISALVIIFSIYNIHWIITAIFAVILICKGVSSMFYDAPGIIMGIIDIIAALFIIFGIAGLLPIKIILFIVLAGKGAMSFI